MCVVSYVSSEFVKQPNVLDLWQQVQPNSITPYISPIAHANLKRQVEELKKALEIARQEDIKQGSPDCEMADKVAVIKGLAKYLGVDLGDVFGGHK